MNRALCLAAALLVAVAPAQAGAACPDGSWPDRDGGCPPAAPWPEPATLSVLGLAIAGLAIARRRR